MQTYSSGTIKIMRNPFFVVFSVSPNYCLVPRYLLLFKQGFMLALREDGDCEMVEFNSL